MTDLDKIRNSLEWDKRMYKMGLKRYEEREEDTSLNLEAVIIVTFIIGIVLGMILMEYIVPWISSYI